MLTGLLVLGALLHVGLAGDTCTEVDVIGDDVEASCNCTCLCDVDCPTTPTPTCATTPTSSQCTCGIAGKNVCTGYDGSSYTMLTNNKFLASTYVGATDADQCKFQVRVDTEDDLANPGDVCVGWMGIAFGVHKKNAAKYERNFRVSLDQGVVEVRGRGYNPTPMSAGCYQSDPFSEEWTFCFTGSDGNWDFHLDVPSLGCSVWICYTEAGVDPNATDNDQLTITVNDYYKGLLTGMCGNYDGDDSNDGGLCTAADPGVPQDCVDGEHQDQG